MVERRLSGETGSRTIGLDTATMLAVLPFGLFALLYAGELLAILEINRGTFVYSLDDPYIHLSLADHLARAGHYGVNAGEFASPSSSILWPFLLVPLLWAGLGVYAPLVLNLFAGALSLAVAGGIADRVLPVGLRPEIRVLYRAALVVAAIPAFNLVGLVFTGMEHGLQIACALLAALGVIDAQRGNVPWYLPVAIVAGPLVRYENLAISVAALLVLLWYGRRRDALIAGLAMAVLVGGFSLFLLSLGLPALPNSVLLKIAPGEQSYPVQRLIYLGTKLVEYPMVTLFLAAPALIVWRLIAARATERDLAFGSAALLVLAAHFAAGRFDWFSRYEVYAVAFVVPLILALYRAGIGRAISALGVRAPALNLAAAACLVIGGSALFAIYLFNGVLRTPLAARSIYVQQYQMHRFVADYFRRPVAVNDIGLVGYGNPHYVLDLWGLSSSEAGRARMHREPGWMDRVMRERGIELAMVYADQEWLGPYIPRQWILLGTLESDARWGTVGGLRVRFFTPDPGAAEALRAHLRRFGESLPEHAQFVPR